MVDLQARRHWSGLRGVWFRLCMGGLPVVSNRLCGYRVVCLLPSTDGDAETVFWVAASESKPQSSEVHRAPILQPPYKLHTNSEHAAPRITGDDEEQIRSIYQECTVTVLKPLLSLGRALRCVTAPSLCRDPIPDVGRVFLSMVCAFPVRFVEYWDVPMTAYLRQQKHQPIGPVPRVAVSAHRGVRWGAIS